jgi:putative transposase
VNFSLPSARVIRTLDRIIEWRGKPQHNAYIERYNRTVRYDWLAQFIFPSIAEVRDFATERLWTYNSERPNMALGGMTPKMKIAMAA